MIKDRWQENPDRILTRFGIFLGILAVLYFGREAIFNLTPLVKSLLLIISSAFFLGGSKLVEDSSTIVALYLFSATSYLTFLAYYTLRMDPSTNTVFLLLAVSAIIFTLIGKKINEYEFHRDKAKKTGILLLIATIALIAVDLNAPEIEYETQFDNTVELGEEPVTVGTLTVKNSYFLPQTYSTQRMEICSADNRRVRLRVSDISETSGIMDGRSEKTIEYEISKAVRAENESSTLESFTIVERENCPEEPEEGILYVYKVPEID